MSELMPVDEAAVRLNISEKTLRRNVREGKYPGKFVGRKCFVDMTGFISESGQLPGSNEEKEATPVSREANDAAALATAEAQRMDAETKLIEAEIKRDEAQGKRDKPQQLEEREKNIEAAEKDLSNRVSEIAAKEEEIKQRYATVQSVEHEMLNRTKQVEADCQEIRDEADAYVAEKEVELWQIEEDIRKKRYTLAQLEVREELELSAFSIKIGEIRRNLTLWLEHTLKHAGRNTTLGERKGRQNDVYTAIGAALWDCYDALKEIMTWLDDAERKADLSPEEAQASYERVVTPVIQKVKRIVDGSRVRTNGNQTGGLSSMKRIIPV